MTPPSDAPTERRVVVVTGGGAGIGAAIATELGRRGAFVATVDPMVTLDGSSALPEVEETTAGRIVAAGGAAEAFPISVTDRSAVEGLFAALVAEHGRLDAVVNVAGITRPTTFARGSEDDWREVVAVHLGGYLNVLGAALPIMAEAGHGRILGVTSGSGWRAADAGAYSCAKRAVAALTWQIGRVAPPGVTINAISPIAVTRMVTEAMARMAKAAAGSSGSGGASAGGSGGGSASTGGLSLGAMPQPEELAPLAAHLVDDTLDWMSGEVLFTAGSEVALVDPPALLEVVTADTEERPTFGLLEKATERVLGPAEAAQTSAGGSNPRLTGAFRSVVGDDLAPSAAARCAVVSDRRDALTAIAADLAGRGVAVTSVPVAGALERAGAVDLIPADATSFADGAATLARIATVDAVVIAIGGCASVLGTPPAWTRALAEHEDVPAWIAFDAGWARAVADVAVEEDRSLRLVTVVDARTSGGRSRAQAAAQLSRVARQATGDRVLAFTVAVETARFGWAHDLAVHLACSPSAAALAGAELVVDDGWIGLRSHPRPRTSLAFEDHEPPAWFDDVLRGLVGPRERPA